MQPTPVRTVVAASLAVAFAAWAPASDARVTRIVIDKTTSITNPLAGTAVCLSNPTACQPYEQVDGRAFGELDPNDPHNLIITDIQNAPRNDARKVEYVASFRIRKPAGANWTTSGLLWHDVPNRGGDVGFPNDSFGASDVQVVSGWQGDNAGNTVVPPNVCLPTTVAACVAPTNVGLANHYVLLPKLAGVTGKVLARIVNKPFGTGENANQKNQPLNVQNAPVPYFPADSADNSKATLTVHLHETLPGVATEGGTIANGNWKFCYGANATFAAPNSSAPSLPVRICLGNDPNLNFEATKLYQLVYEANEPYVLGIGTAAFRDVGSFFKYALADDVGTPNPLNPDGRRVQWEIIRGSSQSGNFTRHLIFLGMNEDEAGRIVHEGAWPLIAGRRVSNNSRWGQPDGVLELYQMGSEGPQWWHSFPDHVRGLHPGGILDRCSETGTCPKIVETFGGAEVYALKMTTSWVGTDPKTDIPLPDNVRRYYLPSSTHGGGNGAMDENPRDARAAPVNCPGNNYGHGRLRANPVPATQLVNRMRVALRDWVVKGTEPPPSKWPLLRGPKNERTLVEPTKAAMGFPSNVPSIPDSIFAPENFVNPILDYDWGPQFDHFNATGVPTNMPPPIRSVIKMLVPKVDQDGNELGGVPTVLRDAPLGTYLGWNITAAAPSDPGYDGRPFHGGQVCDYVGGMVPFAKTQAQREANKDPRLSLEERYKTHDGYVAAVRAAADNAACQGYLNAGSAAAAMGAKCTTTLAAGVQDDWVEVVTRAMNSNVCNQAGDGGKCNPLKP